MEPAEHRPHVTGHSVPMSESATVVSAGGADPREARTRAREWMLDVQSPTEAHASETKVVHGMAPSVL